MMSFSHLEKKYGIQQQDFLLILSSLFYNVLQGYNTTNTYFLKGLWERELNVEITDIDWCDAWKNAKTLSVCNRVRAMQTQAPTQGPHISLPAS